LFRGVNALNLDTKGRMAIPTRYRERLQSYCAAKLVVTIDRDRCLLIYPLPIWEEVERKLKQLPSFNQNARKLQRLYIGHATEVEMDGQGRVLLAPELRRFANLQKQAVLIGQGDKFELWDEESWNKLREAWLEETQDLDASELLPGLETLSI
jgi:MraZ protein